MIRRRWAHFGNVIALLALIGCRHQAHIALVQMAPIPMISVPPPTHQSEPLPQLDTETLAPLSIQISRLPLPRFRARPTSARQLALLLPVQPTPMLLGELSTGGESNDPSLRQQTETLLRGQQQRLMNLPHSATSLHSQQVEQARLFLKDALAAWHDHDLQGAHVLALKTKLLLDEL